MSSPHDGSPSRPPTARSSPTSSIAREPTESTTQPMTDDNTDDATAADLRERVDDLEAQLDQQQQTIQQMLPSRRSLLKAGGAGAAALLLGSAASGSASAATGTIGSTSQRFNFYGDTVDANVVDTDELNNGGPISDGDGTERQIWVIAAGASDPAGADPEDIIFEEQ